MPTELEAKMKLIDRRAVEQRLRDLNAVDRGSRFEVNAFYDTPERKLLSKDSGVRLRSMRKPDGSTTCVITFKGPQAKGQLKSRSEIEFGIEDIEKARDLLAELGYSKLLLRFEKRRHTYDLGNCEVVLDELPHLGSFIEIEGPDEASVMATRDQLGLANEPLITRGYSSLLDAAICAGEIAGPDVRFA
ncbi:MAG: class IV adenylate cyclase [Tepidisphaeraceae bacterium]